jgi:hypothetical protein
MPGPPTQRRLRKREIVLAISAGALAAAAAAGILSESGEGGPPFVVVNEADERTYQLADFERISTTGPQDVEITFGETFAVRAEGATGSLEVVVEDGELIIRPRNGWDIPGLGSTKLFVTMPTLRRIAMTGSGDVSIDQLKGDRFTGVIEGFAGDFNIEGLDVDEAEFTISGPGDITAAGVARTTRITIEGPGEFKASDLRTERAVVMVRGPGDVQLTANSEAEVTVEGPGEVDIDGTASCTVTKSGPSSVSCGDRDYD